ncbi:hypothetical protein GCM10027299_16270 [Larkinella ripae]
MLTIFGFREADEMPNVGTTSGRMIRVTSLKTDSWPDKELTTEPGSMGLWLRTPFSYGHL